MAAGEVPAPPSSRGGHVGSPPAPLSLPPCVPLQRLLSRVTLPSPGCLPVPKGPRSPGQAGLPGALPRPWGLWELPPAGAGAKGTPTGTRSPQWPGAAGSQGASWGMRHPVGGECLVGGCHIPPQPQGQAPAGRMPHGAAWAGGHGAGAVPGVALGDVLLPGGTRGRPDVSSPVPAPKSPRGLGSPWPRQPAPAPPCRGQEERRGVVFAQAGSRRVLAPPGIPAELPREQGAGGSAWQPQTPAHSGGTLRHREAARMTSPLRWHPQGRALGARRAPGHPWAALAGQGMAARPVLRPSPSLLPITASPLQLSPPLQPGCLLAGPA